MTIEKDCGKNFQLFFEEEWKKEKLKIESIIWNETKEVIGFYIQITKMYTIFYS